MSDALTKPCTVLAMELDPAIDNEEIDQAVALVEGEVRNGHRVVVVCAARDSAETRELAPAPSFGPYRRERDQLQLAADQIVAAILAMALEARGHRTSPRTSGDAGLRAQRTLRTERLLGVDPSGLDRILGSDAIAILAGRHGHDDRGDIVGLGPAGTERAALALALSLGARRCHLVFCPQHRRLDASANDGAGGTASILVEWGVRTPRSTRITVVGQTPQQMRVVERVRRTLDPLGIDLEAAAHRSGRVWCDIPDVATEVCVGDVADALRAPRDHAPPIAS